MNSTNIGLFIQQLTITEKTHIKKHMQLNHPKKGNEYLLIFDFYDKKIWKKAFSQSQWDQELQKTLTRKKIRGKLADLKTEFIEIIYTALVGMQTRKGKLFQVSYELNLLQILFNHQFYNEVSNRLAGLKKTIKAKEDYKNLVEILNWEMTLLQLSSGKEDFENLQGLINEKENYLSLYQEESKYQHIFQQIYLILERDMKLIKEASQSLFESLNANPLLEAKKIEEHRSNAQIRLFYWSSRIKSLYHRSSKINQNYQKAYDYAVQLVDLFESNQSYLKNYPKEYVASLLSLSKSCHFLDKQQEVEKIIHKLEAFSKKHPIVKNEVLEAIYDIDILKCINAFQFERADDLASKMLENWSFFKSSVKDGKQLFYGYHNCIIYWLTNEKNKLEEWIYLTLDINRSYKGKNYYFAAQLLNLLIKCDQKDFSTFDSSEETIRKTMHNHKHYQDYEKIVLQALRDLYKIEYCPNKTAEAKLDIFKNLKIELLGLKNKKDFKKTNWF